MWSRSYCACGKIRTTSIERVGSWCMTPWNGLRHQCHVMPLGTEVWPHVVVGVVSVVAVVSVLAVVSVVCVVAVVSVLLTLYTYIITHGVEMRQKVRKFIHLCSIKKSSKCGYFLACAIFRTSFCWRGVHIWKTSTYNPKNREYSWPCCGSLNTLWCED